VRSFCVVFGKFIDGGYCGGVDTKYYWDLSKHIFRYNHHNQVKDGLGNIHTVNECMCLLGFVGVLR
jgi:Gly-Xaa carboxypeptidase